MYQAMTGRLICGEEPRVSPRAAGERLGSPEEATAMTSPETTNHQRYYREPALKLGSAVTRGVPR